MSYKFAYILPALLLLVGCCTGRKAVSAESHARHDSTSCVSSRADTLIEKDSVAVTIETRHDTVYRTEIRERVRWRVRELRDTVRVLERDSVASATAERDGAAGRKGKSPSWAGFVAGASLPVVLYMAWRWRRGRWK